MLNEEQIKSLETSYNHQYNPRNTFGENLKTYISDILHDKNIKTYEIQHRTKDVDSIINKINRKDLPFKEDLSNIHDITGIRIITNHREDAKEISATIDNIFEVSEEHSSDKSESLKYNVFDYTSIHKIAKIPTNLRTEREWAYCKDFMFEIQIRTILQHAWATTSHELLYKREDNIPTTIKRRIAMLAGMLELADEEFQAIKDILQPTKGNTEKQPDTKLNQIQIKEFLQNSTSIAPFYDYANQTGFTIRNTIRDAFIDELLSITTKIQITSINQLESQTEQKIQLMKLALDSLNANWKFKSYNKDALMVMIFILAFKDRIDIDEATLGWGTEFSEYVKKAATSMDNKTT